MIQIGQRLFSLLMGLVWLSLWSVNPAGAASLADSVLEIPRNTIFELNGELDIPANRNFILLGRNEFSESINDLNKTYNNNEGRYGFYHYNDYLGYWQRSAAQSYHACLERHRNYYSYNTSTPSSTNNTIVTHGYGNTNIIVNNQGTTTETHYGSYVGNNNCIRPEHTIAVLLLDKDEVAEGGIFRHGYQFKVKSVSSRRHGDFYTVTIRFKHKIAKGVRIITTVSPEQIRISQLNTNRAGKGFWNNVGVALANLFDIGGNHFNIILQDKRYFD